MVDVTCTQRVVSKPLRKKEQKRLGMEISDFEITLGLKHIEF
jgi:hypothetical protein